MVSLLQKPPASWLPTMLVLSKTHTFTVPQPVCYLACLGLSCSLLSAYLYLVSLLKTHSNGASWSTVVQSHLA